VEPGGQGLTGMSGGERRGVASWFRDDGFGNGNRSLEKGLVRAWLSILLFGNLDRLEYSEFTLFQKQNLSTKIVGALYGESALRVRVERP
jgi:hypothetical protein